MKKVFSIIGVALGISLVILFMSSAGQKEINRAKDQATQADIFAVAASTVPIPSVSYFTERRTIQKFMQRYDKPSVVTYVYLFNFGQVIGYYVADGKPASIRSYLVPEEAYYSNGATLTQPNIDGTYGEDNPGIRFFTAEGTAVEFGGSGAAYLYTDAPLPINAPKLNTKPAK